jgi:hypothetical protein
MDEWLSYAEAAERLNTTVEAVRLRANLENGYARSSKYLPLIAKALDVSPAELDPELWAALRAADLIMPDEAEPIDQEALLIVLGPFPTIPSSLSDSG